MQHWTKFDVRSSRVKFINRRWGVRVDIEGGGSCVTCLIPRLHDQANIEQSSSKRPANAFKIHVHDVCSNCSMFSRCLLDVCLIIAWSCKQGIKGINVSAWCYMYAWFSALMDWFTNQITDCYLFFVLDRLLRKFSTGQRSSKSTLDSHILKRFYKITSAQKSIPDIFDFNLKTNYQILIMFGTNISDTTCHQMTIQFPISPNVCFCTSVFVKSQLVKYYISIECDTIA